MAKKNEPVDDLLDALVWMRRKAKRHEAVDDLIDALMKMRRKAKEKTSKRKPPRKKTSKPAGARRPPRCGLPASGQIFAKSF